jgi:hypothetical protein
MKPLFRLSLCAGLFGALIVGGGYACPNLSTRLGLNPAAWLEVQRQLEDERRRGETLDQQSQIVWHNLETKFRVLGNLQAGRLTLYEAAARFRSLNHPGIDDYPALFRLIYQGQSDDERWCRQVLNFVRSDWLDHSDLTSLADQLEAELTQELAKGSLHLPE